MDVRYINPFVKSICNTFETMCELKVSVGKPTLSEDQSAANDVSAIIGFSGDAAGSVVLRFSFDVAAKIASSFAKIEITPDHADFADALGELANMVAGGAKSKFEGLMISISLPNVVIGKHHHFPVSKNAPRLIIPCGTSVGSFNVEIGMVLARKGGKIPELATSGATS
ncbi:MAG: chemotaxis protein CheX [Planctomycetes bacterium]|nr:chemotaxis protein CheX [Planctomycetota bacterium]